MYTYTCLCMCVCIYIFTAVIGNNIRYNNEIKEKNKAIENIFPTQTFQR